MALRLGIGELPARAWDWITFNDLSEDEFNFEMFGQALAVAETPDELHIDRGTLLFPAASVAGMSQEYMLFYLYNGIPARHGKSLGLGELVSERAYAQFSGDYPKSIMSARFESGHVVIMDLPIEELYLSGTVSSIVVHPDTRVLDRILKPMFSSDVDCCNACGNPFASCMCIDAEHYQTNGRRLTDYWSSTDVDIPVLDSDRLRMWRRYKAFLKCQCEKVLHISLDAKTPDALALGCQNLEASSRMARYKMLLPGAQELLQDQKMAFLQRWISQWSPYDTIAVQTRTDPCDMPLALQATSEHRGSSDLGFSRAEQVPKPTCEICGATFSRKYEVLRHVRLVHDGAKDFKCSFCDRKFGMSQHLQEHVTTVHQKRRDYSCDLCVARFSTKSKLNRHRRGVHEKERCYICLQCGGEYFQQSDLDRHWRRMHEPKPS